MTVTFVPREHLLERYGRWYGEERFAIAFTSTTEGDDAKRVTTQGWDKTLPLRDGDFGASYVSGRGKTKNPVIVLRPSNLIVLECDTEDDLLRVEELGLPLTITVRSSKPYKRHYYFRPPADMMSLPYVAFRFESGKLTADSGRYFLAPPSIHPSGAVYAFLPDRGPDEADIAELPAETYLQLAGAAKRETDEQTERIHVDPGAKVQAGQRADRIFRYASMLRRWGLSRDQILEQAFQWNDDRCDPPIERTRVEMQVDGAMKKDGDQEIAHALEHPLPDAEERNPILDVEITSPEGSWRRIDLNHPQYAIPPEPPVILGLLYEGKRHVFSGPPESAKTLIAYAAALETIRAGRTVAIVDFEMGPAGSWRLLNDLGATEDEIDRIFFVSPDEPPDDELRTLINHNPWVTVIDAAAGAYDATGLDDNSRKDAERFSRQWIKPIWQAGLSTLLIDHVVKNTETRGKYAIGSERKIGTADIHLGFDTVKAVSRGHSGIIKVHVHKDRGAYLTRPIACIVELSSDENTHRITWTITSSAETDEETGEFRPTFQMERVSRYLEEQTEPVSRTNVETTVKGKSAKAIRQALDALTKEGFIVETPGPRNARNVASSRPYRQHEDPKHTTPSDPVSPRPDGVTTTPSDAVPPTGTRTGSTSRNGRDPVQPEIDEQDQALIEKYELERLREQERTEAARWEHDER